MNPNDAAVAAFIGRSLACLERPPYSMQQSSPGSNDRNVWATFANASTRIDVFWERYSGTVECEIGMTAVAQRPNYRSLNLMDYFDLMPPEDQRTVKESHGLERSDQNIVETCALIVKYAHAPLMGDVDAFLDRISRGPAS